MFEQAKNERSTRASWFAVRNGKKSPSQETGLENRGPLEFLNDTKLLLNEHELPP